MKEQNVLEKKKFKCQNCELKATRYIALTGYEKGRECWDIYKGKQYIDSMDNGIGKFHSLTWGEVDSFKEYIEIWKSRYIFENFRTASLHKDKNAYMVDLYGDIDKKDFDVIMGNLKFLLDKGYSVHYNDEGGVGYFNKKGKQYEATHHRWGTERKEKLTLDGIADFLRSFFSVGYELKPTW